MVCSSFLSATENRHALTEVVRKRTQIYLLQQVQICGNQESFTCDLTFFIALRMLLTSFNKTVCKTHDSRSGGMLYNTL